MNMRIERNVIQPQIDETVGKVGKAGKPGKIGADPNLTVDHVSGGDHRSGLGPLNMSEMLPPPKPNALDALQPTPAMPATPSTLTTSGVESTPQTDDQNSDFVAKVGPPAANAVAAAMLEIGLAQIQTDQTMAVSQEDARKADLSSYETQMNNAVSQIKDQANDEKSAALIEGLVGGFGAALSIAGSVGGAFAAGEDVGFATRLLGGTEMGAGLLSTTGGLFGTAADAISKGTAGKWELRHQGDQKTDETQAGIFQSAEGSAQQYRDKYWEMQDKALSSIQQVIQGQGQAGQAVASNV